MALFLIKVAGGGASAADATSTDIKRVLMLFDASKNLPANLSMEEAIKAELPNNALAGTICCLLITL